MMMIMKMMMMMKQMQNDKVYFKRLYQFASDLYYASHANRDPQLLKEELQGIFDKMEQTYGVPETVEEYEFLQKQYPEVHELYMQLISHIAFLTQDEEVSDHE